MTTRPAVLRALTDLFCLREAPSEEEVGRYCELALQILPDAGPSTRLYVAAKLARHPAAPPRMLSSLAAADPVCATLLLEHARNFPVETQIELAFNADRDTAVALAGRPHLDASVSEALVARNDPHVTKALAGNASAELTAAAVDEVKKGGRPDRAYAQQLDEKTGRASPPEDFLAAQQGERARIVAEARRSTLGQRPARIVRDEDLLTELRERAIERDWSGFSSVLARKIGIHESIVSRLAADPGGEPLALLLALVGASHTDAVRICLCCEAPIAHSYQKVRELADMAADTPPTVAGSLVFAMCGARPRISASSQSPAREGDRITEGVRASQPEPLRAQDGADSSAQALKTQVVLRRTSS